MTVRCRMLFVVLAALVTGCDPDRVAEREAREAQEQATLDSLNTAAEAEAAAMVDSVAEALAADSSPELDSTGAWNFNEDEVAVTEEEVEELSPEDWSRLAQDTVQVRNVHFDQAALDAYLSDPDLDYDRERHEERLWWTRFMRWLNDRLNDLFDPRAGDWSSTTSSGSSWPSRCSPCSGSCASDSSVACSAWTHSGHDR